MCSFLPLFLVPIFQISRLNNPWVSKQQKIINQKKIKELKKKLKELKKQDKEFQQGTVGAAIPAGTKIEKVDVLPENQIQPTGAGVFGEQGPFNPIFRVLKNGIGSAQEFIERTLEGIWIIIRLPKKYYG